MARRRVLYTMCDRDTCLRKLEQTGCIARYSLLRPWSFFAHFSLYGYRGKVVGWTWGPFLSVRVFRWWYGRGGVSLRGFSGRLVSDEQHGGTWVLGSYGLPLMWAYYGFVGLGMVAGIAIFVSAILRGTARFDEATLLPLFAPPVVLALPAVLQRLGAGSRSEDEQVLLDFLKRTLQASERPSRTDD